MINTFALAFKHVYYVMFKSLLTNFLCEIVTLLPEHRKLRLERPLGILALRYLATCIKTVRKEEADIFK